MTAERVDLFGALVGAIDRAREDRRPTFDQAALDREMGESMAEPDLTPEQDLRAAVADILSNVEHFAGCHRYVEGDGRCTCLVGRLEWAINAEQVTEPRQDGAA